MQQVITGQARENPMQIGLEKFVLGKKGLMSKGRAEAENCEKFRKFGGGLSFKAGENRTRNGGNSVKKKNPEEVAKNIPGRKNAK